MEARGKGEKRLRKGGGWRNRRRMKERETAAPPMDCPVCVNRRVVGGCGATTVCCPHCGMAKLTMVLDVLVVGAVLVVGCDAGVVNVVLVLSLYT